MGIFSSMIYSMIYSIIYSIIYSVINPRGAERPRRILGGISATVPWARSGVSRGYDVLFVT